MLQFFRRHQKYFFFVITVVIVISFSFFGTYSTLDHPNTGDRIAFQSVTGDQVRHSEVEEIALFIGSDDQDKALWGMEWGPNFLNDGVIVKDFLDTGLGALLVQSYRLQLAQELQQRWEREKRYPLYKHPGAPFISAELVWSYVVPQMSTALATLRKGQDPLDPESFAARAELYLTERKFPASSLRQVLRYQQQQYNWLTPDPQLERADLSLFGYHTLEDWFGPRFIRLASQFIINAAKIAERKGYRVTQEEAMADLLRQAQENYAKFPQLTQLGIHSPEQYLRAQLQRMGMDEARAAIIWRQVLLFRRLFQGVGNAIFVDALPFDELNRYALEKTDGTLYQLPESLWLPNYRALQKFQLYLDLIAKKKPESPLGIPTQFVQAEELLKSYPELVQKRYLLEVSEVNTKALQGRVTVKEMWNWQLQDANWKRLTSEFPELGVKQAKTATERFNALESLDATTRSRADALARAAIVAEHPDWLQQALDAAEPDTSLVRLRLQGGHLPFTGVTKREELVALLDKAPVGADKESPALKQFTGDGISYYRIRVLEKGKGWEILTYAEASEDDTLDQLLTRLLEPYYTQVRESSPHLFRKEGGGFRPFAEVQDSVADLYFKDLLVALEREYSRHVQGAAAPNRNVLAPYRLSQYMRSVEEKLKQGAGEDLLSKEEPEPVDTLPPAKNVARQFTLQQRAHAFLRSDALSPADKEALFTVAESGWTPPFTRPNGDVWFFHVQKRSIGAVAAASAEQVDKVRDLIADDAEQLLMRSLLREMKEKEAIRLTPEPGREAWNDTPNTQPAHKT